MATGPRKVLPAVVVLLRTPASGRLLGQHAQMECTLEGVVRVKDDEGVAHVVCSMTCMKGFRGPIRSAITRGV